MNQRLVDELQLLFPVHAIEEFDLLRGGFESAGALAGNVCGVDEVLVKAELRVQALLGHFGDADHQSEEPRLEHLHPLDRKSVVSGTGVSVRVDTGGSRQIKKK